jgi:hypothetical protein
MAKKRAVEIHKPKKQVTTSKSHERLDTAPQEQLASTSGQDDEKPLEQEEFPISLKPSSQSHTHILKMRTAQAVPSAALKIKTYNQDKFNSLATKKLQSFNTLNSQIGDESAVGIDDA